VLLPLQFNDGRDVPAEWLADAVLEVVERFGAASYETQRVDGHWRHAGVIHATISSASSWTYLIRRRTAGG
jgi:hypothetical protein